MQIVNLDCAAVIHAILAVFLRGDAAAAAENVRQRQLVIGQHDLDRAHAVVQHLVELCQQRGQTQPVFALVSRISGSKATALAVSHLL